MKGTLEILRHMGICALMALLLLPAAGIGAWRAPVYALEGIDIRQEASTVNAQQGESGVQFAMILKNNTSATFENVSAEVDNPSGFSNGALYTPTNSTLEPGATEIYIFKIDIGEAAGSGN
ncbi:MAG: hypothetical protein LBT26_01135, partial [Clostridiales Family XIII bacterium]|nr:hypothetical protein [Clostridiales Family XIII bacterium]